MNNLKNQKPAFLDFFAGSGLVCEGMKNYFKPIWANDICKKKAAVFTANHPKKIFTLGPIEEINGAKLPLATLSWGSFPCQDLSLAGKIGGLSKRRSGLVWEWLRVMDEMKKRPLIAVAENVVGLVSANKGEYYRNLHNALVDRGYKVGAVILDASYWVPQSRKRVFVIGVDKSIDTKNYELEGPTKWIHSSSIVRVSKGLANWIWWNIPEPSIRNNYIETVIDFDAGFDDEQKTNNLLKLIPENHIKRIHEEKYNKRFIFPGYKRIRNGKQVLELRFDGIAGCLRTPQGGSSRQFLVFLHNNKFKTRLLTVKEAASLMGVRKSYIIPGSYNDGYKAMGDAVAVPVVRYLAKHLLLPIIKNGFGNSDEHQ